MGILVGNRIGLRLAPLLKFWVENELPDEIPRSKIYSLA